MPSTYDRCAARYGASDVMRRVADAVRGGATDKAEAIAKALDQVIDRVGWLAEGPFHDDDHRRAHELCGVAGWYAARGLVLHSHAHGPDPYLPQAVGELLWACQLADYAPDVQAADRPADAARRKAEALLTAALDPHLR